MAHGSLTLDLAGPVRLFDGGGRDLSPRLTRSRALLALLGATEGHRRSRTWIQDKLWSEKNGPEGAAALRYTLWDIRRSLGPHRLALVCEQGCVALDGGAVRVRLPEPASIGKETPVFAEGLDVDDAEFNTWLREYREFRSRAITAPALSENYERPLRSSVWIFPEVGDDDDLKRLAQSLATKITARLIRTTGALIHIAQKGERQASHTGTDVRVVLRLSRVRGRVLAQVSIINIRRDQVLWTNDRDLPGRLSGQDPLNPFANLTAAAIGRALATMPENATETEAAAVAFCRALSGPSSFAANDLLSAIGDLGALQLREVAARSAARRALYLGWLVIERVAPCAETALEEARALSRQAIELDPTLSEAYAVRAELADFDRNSTLAIDLARRAVEIDPFDPLSVAALAKAEARIGNAQTAYRKALFAQQLAVGAANPAWWAMLCCTTAHCSGNVMMALRHAETAHDFCHDFRPPLRFLTILRFLTGDREGSARALVSLRDREPEFSPELLADPRYPLRSVERSTLKQFLLAAGP